MLGAKDVLRRLVVQQLARSTLLSAELPPPGAPLLTIGAKH